MVEKVVIDLSLPPDFPEKYQDALIKAIDLCHVKKHFSQPPEFEYLTTTAQ
jgi:ribosomal protein S12 methylthiotransferase accessory factor